MPGVGKLLKQAQKMQKAMETVQAQLAEMTVEGSVSYTHLTLPTT